MGENDLVVGGGGDAAVRRCLLGYRSPLIYPIHPIYPEGSGRSMSFRELFPTRVRTCGTKSIRGVITLANLGDQYSDKV